MLSKWQIAAFFAVAVLAFVGNASAQPADSCEASA
jgi:hypothetical protein